MSYLNSALGLAATASHKKERFEKRFRLFVLDYESNILGGVSLDKYRLESYREVFWDLYLKSGYDQLDSTATLLSTKK